MSARLTYVLNKRPQLSEKQQRTREAKDTIMEKMRREMFLISLLQKKPTHYMLRERYAIDKLQIQEKTNFARKRIEQEDEYGWTFPPVILKNEDEYIESFIGNYINLLRFYIKYPRLLNTNTEWLDICHHLQRWYQVRETTSIVADEKRYHEMMFCYDLAKHDAQYCVMYYKWFLALVLCRSPLLLDVKRMIISFLL
jgi:hypothetical protein